MQEMNQGEEYVEEYEENEEPKYEDEGEEETSAEFDTIFGIPKRVFILGAAVFVIAVLVVIVLIMWKGGSKSGDTPVTPGADSEAASIEVYDGSGNLLGYADGLTDGAMLITADGMVLGYIDSAGTDSAFDSSGSFLASYSSGESSDTYDDTYATDDGLGYEDDLSQLPADNYTDTYDLDSDEDTVELRKAGYTGDEIELAKSLGISTDNLLEEAKIAQDEALKKRLKKVSNKKSKEFLTLYNNSIFCMNKMSYEAYTEGVDSARNYTGSYVVNSDYWKVPTYGHQLLIKCKIANDTYAFYCVTPDRWATLPEEGNIVLEVNYTMYGTNNINMYITSIKEIETTQHTVNTLDSATSLEDILSSDSTYEGDYSDYDDGYDEEESDDGNGLNQPW